MPLLKKPAWLTKAQNVPKPATQTESPKSASLFHRSVSNVEDVIREQRPLIEVEEPEDGGSRRSDEADFDEFESRHNKRRRISDPDEEEMHRQIKNSNKKPSPRQLHRSSTGTMSEGNIDSPIRTQKGANASIIDLDESSEESSGSDTPYVPSTRPAMRREPQDSTAEKEGSRGVENEKKRTENAIMIEDDEEEPPEEEQDPDLAEMERLARVRLAERKRKEAEEAKSQAFLGDEEAGSRTVDPVIQIYIDPKIEGTEALMVKIRYSMRLKEIREAWCARQKQWPPGVTVNDVIFAFRDKRVLDWSTIKNLGVVLNEQGEPILRAASKTGKSGPGDRVIIEATTLPLLEQAKKEQEEQRLREERGETLPTQSAATSAPLTAAEPEQQPEQALLRIVLKSKSYPEQKLRVKPVCVWPIQVTAHWTLLTSSRIRL